MMSNNIDSRQKIINKALDLFYNKGYKATGINQLISESGVAKNTFYYHFHSKDDLCVAYLQEMDRNWKNSLKQKINQYKDPYDKLFAPIEYIKEYDIENNFRGCPFLNIASEITDGMSDIRKEVAYHKDSFRSIIRGLLKDLKNSESKYSKLDISYLADSYHIMVEGAIKAGQSFQDAWPYDIAKKNLENLLNP